MVRLLVATSLLASGIFAVAGGGLADANSSCTPPADGGIPSSVTVLRPTSGGPGGYPTPEAPPYHGKGVVIHYVTSGQDAPDLADVDRDRVPDYVEQAASAADRAIAFYANPSYQGASLAGFRALPCDLVDGPKVDIYVEDIAGFGRAYDSVHGEGGSFVVVDPHLQDVERTGGIEFTTAHEMFHLVQFGYVPAGMPAWVSEGTANLFAFLLLGIENDVLLTEIDRWFRVPETPLSNAELSGCERCYGGIFWWWLTVLSQRPILARYFELLERHAEQRIPLGTGARELEQVFTDEYERAGIAPFAPDAMAYEFEAMSEAMYLIRAPLRPPPLYGLRPDHRSRRVSRTIRPLSAHYIKVTLGASVRALRVKVRGAAGLPFSRVLHDIRGKRCTTALTPRLVSDGPRMVRLRELLLPVTRVDSRGPTVLMLTNASARAVKYQLEYQGYSTRKARVGMAWECGVRD